MKKLYDEPAAYSTADIANALMQERDRKLPVRSSFFNALVPKVSAQDAAINRPDPVERASLFPFATYPDGSTKLAIPGMIAEDIPRAFTAPSRAYRGEIPDEDMISEGLNFAGNMAMTGSIAPKPTNAAGMFGGRLAKTADHAALARAEEMAADQSAPRVPNPIRAYHGSPHDFDRFDSSKIGTGEGAQAYGHGLYFAEREGVARSYRDALGGQKLSDGSKFDDANPAHKAAAYIAGTSSKDEAIKALVDDIAMSRRQYDEAHAQRLMRAKGMLERGEPIPTIGNGKMYEVALHASPDDFLDWDKPLSQQSEKVRNGFERSHGDWLKSASPHIENKPVADWIDMLRGRGPSSGFMNEKLSSDLKDAGIPGIRYLDQGSRAAGEGSSNYVVFDDALIDIIRKYMNPQTAIAPGALMVEGAKDRRQ